MRNLLKIGLFAGLFVVTILQSTSTAQAQRASRPISRRSYSFLPNEYRDNAPRDIWTTPVRRASSKALGVYGGRWGM